jgi:hypothetical protein
VPPGSSQAVSDESRDRSRGACLSAHIHAIAPVNSNPESSRPADSRRRLTVRALCLLTRCREFRRGSDSFGVTEWDSKSPSHCPISGYAKALSRALLRRGSDSGSFLVSSRTAKLRRQICGRDETSISRATILLGVSQTQWRVTLGVT